MNFTPIANRVEYVMIVSTTAEGVAFTFQLT